MRCRHTHQIASGKRGFDEHLRVRESVRRKIVICQGSGLISIVEKGDGPGSFLETRGLDELRRCSPHRRDKFVNIGLHSLDQSIEVDTESDCGLAEASDCGNFTLVESAKYRFAGHLTPLFLKSARVLCWLLPRRDPSPGK